MIQDILIGLTTVLFIVLAILIGYLFFDDNDWDGRK
jgi:hypothetical protein